MECPYCKYVFEKVDDGEKEESFYVMPIKNRGSGQYYSEVVTPTVCKKCEKSFIGEKMKCPHCNYFYGYDFDKGSVKPKEGPFYVMPIKMEREDWFSTELASLLACPKCRKTFIGG